MNSSAPISNLHRLTLIMTIWINLFLVVLLISSRGMATGYIFTAIVKSFLIIYLLGITNIFVIHITQKNCYNGVKKTDWLRYVISAILSLLVFAALGVLFEFLDPDPKQSDLKTRIITSVLIFVIFHSFVVILHNQVILQYSKTQADLENMKLKATVSEASNLLLRQQIHPHFLFNSLTILKSIYKKDTVKGEFYLTKLANFLRASISNHDTKTSLVQTELILCKDYMEMQQIRFGNAIEYNVDVPEEFRNKWVPFFSIQVLLENAIKHNTMTDANPLIISVKGETDHITVENNLQLRINKEESTGQGLANLAERYRLLSDDKISIKQDQKSFSVTIKMYDNENSDH